MASTRKINRRAQPIKVHLLPTVEADRIVLDTWNACRVHDRAPEVFRAALLRGLRSLMDSGELPEAVLNHHGLRERLARRLPAAFMPPPAAAYAPPHQVPAPPPPMASPASGGYVPPMAAEPEEEPAFDESAILDLMPSFEDA